MRACYRVCVRDAASPSPESPEGADTEALHRAVASPHWVSIGLLLHHEQLGQRNSSLHTYKPNGATQHHNEAARRWLLRRWECVVLPAWIRPPAPRHLNVRHAAERGVGRIC